MLSFDFATSGHIHFGRGSLARLADYLGADTSPILLLTGQHNAVDNPILPLINGRSIPLHQAIIVGEPDSNVIDQEAEKARVAGIKAVISFGGGSVLDAGKAIAMLITNGGVSLDYAEIVGKGKNITIPSLPNFAIPTTAGTGSEVTKNAVIIFKEKKVKASIRSPLMIPQVAIVDPETMRSVPPEITASTGMDALTQVLESYLSSRSTILVDSMCEKAIPMAFKSLAKVYENGNDLDAREEMAYVSLIGGVSLANAGLGAVHGFAAAIGGMYSIPHGSICACFLPVVFEANYQALMKKNPNHPAINKCRQIAMYSGIKNGDVSELIEKLYNLRFDLNIPGMRKFGINRSMAGDIAESTARTSSMKGNPIDLSFDQLVQILIKCV